MVADEVSYQVSNFVNYFSSKSNLRILDFILNFLIGLLQYLVQALYDFTPQEVGELEFKRGDVITVTGKCISCTSIDKLTKKYLSQ